MRRIIEENSEKQIKFSNETLNRLYPLPRIPKKYVKSPEHSRVFYVYADPNVTYALPRSVEEIDREQKACYQPNPLFLHDFKFPIDIPFLPQEFEMKSILRQPDDFQRIISERKMKEQLLQREFELQLKYAKEKKQAKRLAEKQNPRNNNDNKNMNQDQQLEKENNNNLLNKSGEISEEDFEEDEEDEEEALIRNAFNYATDQEGRIHSLPRVFENISSDQATSSSANPVPIHQIKREFYKVKSPPHSNKFKKLHWNQLKESKFIYTDELDMLLREEGNEPDKEWRENKKRTRIERLSIPIHDRSIIPKKLNEINAKINQKTQSRNIKLSGNKEDESFNPLAVSADEVLKKFKPQKQQIEVYQQLGKALKLKQLDPKAVAERSNTEYIFYKENKENKGEKQLDLSQYSKVPYESLSMGWKPSPNQLQISIKLFEDKMNENKGQQIKIKQMEKKRKEGRIQEIVQKDGSINGIESDDEFNYGSQSTKVNVAPTLLFMIPHAFIQEDEDETNGQQQQQQFTNGKQSEYTEVDSPSERAKIRKQQEKQQEKMKNNKLNYSQLSDEQKSTIVQQTYYLQKQLTMEHAKEEDIKCKQRMDEVLKEKSRKEKNKIKQQHISQEQCLTSGDENEEEFEVELNQTTNLGITTKKELYEKKNKERQERLKKKKEFAERSPIERKQSAINSSQLQVNQSIPVSQRSDAGEFLSLRNGVQRGKEKEIKQWNSYEDNVEINSENKKSRNILDSLDQDNGILGNGNNKFKIMHLRGIYQTESIEDNTERQSAQKLKETSKINEKDLKNKRLPSLHTPGQHQSQNHQNRTESQLQKSLSSTRTLSIRGSAQLPSGHSGYRAAVNKT
ncbi:MAG: hypothetical protein EZS28_000924 [Streblomastix strix]|uniref:Uncharacterized protein n=1 Tax=Streblomastix strix TaxID=222440 RepID=A0A5J4X9H9_9EUKA|nr:MAG: hypothetical protein EZS28_000924 [Streblomastix strix]